MAKSREQDQFFYRQRAIKDAARFGGPPDMNPSENPPAGNSKRASNQELEALAANWTRLREARPDIRIEPFTEDAVQSFKEKNPDVILPPFADLARYRAAAIELDVKEGHSNPDAATTPYKAVDPATRQDPNNAFLTGKQRRRLERAQKKDADPNTEKEQDLAATEAVSSEPLPEEITSEVTPEEPAREVPPAVPATPEPVEPIPWPTNEPRADDRKEERGVYQSQERVNPESLPWDEYTAETWAEKKRLMQDLLTQAEIGLEKTPLERESNELVVPEEEAQAHFERQKAYLQTRSQAQNVTATRKFGTRAGAMFRALGENIRDLPGNVAGDVARGVRGIASSVRHPIEFVTKVGEKMEAGINYVNFFTDRKKTFAEKAAKMKLDFTALVEGYNKLPPRQKFYITAALIGSSAATAAAAIPTLPTILASGLYAQRALAGAGFGLNRFNDAAVENRSTATRVTYAGVLTVLYTGSTIIAGRYATEELTKWLSQSPDHPDPLSLQTPTDSSETSPMSQGTVPEEGDLKSAQQAWRERALTEGMTSVGLEDQLELGHPNTPENYAAMSKVLSELGVAPEFAHPEVWDDGMLRYPSFESPVFQKAGIDVNVLPTEALDQVNQPVPEVTAAARAGRGYEDMAWRLWDELKDKKIDPSQFSKDSDIYKILTADKESIKGLVHRLAEEHGFYKEGTGESVLIARDAKLGFNAKGDLAFTDSSNTNVVEAPAQADTTAAPKVAEAPEAPKSAQIPEVVAEPETPPPSEAPAPSKMAEATGYRGFESKAEYDQTMGRIEREQGVPIDHDVTRDAEGNTYLSNEKGHVQLYPDRGGYVEGPPPTADAPQDILEADEFNDTLDRAAEPGTDMAEIPDDFAVNKHGLAYDKATAHIYADKGDEHYLLSGGSKTERDEIMEKFFTDPNTKNSVLYTADDDNKGRLAWRLINGEVIPSPAREKTWWGGMRDLKPPHPDEFRRVVK